MVCESSKRSAGLLSYGQPEDKYILRESFLMCSEVEVCHNSVKRVLDLICFFNFVFH